MQISISGAPGSGKSTIGKLLSNELKLPHFSTGQKRGDLAQALGLTLDQINERAETNPELDLALDRWQEEQGQTGAPGIYDGLMAWHFIPQSFKIQLTVDPAIAANRIFENRRASKTRDDEPLYSSPQETEAIIINRHQANRNRLKTLYGIDLTDPANFDLTIDTTHQSPEEILATILKHLGSTAPTR